MKKQIIHSRHCAGQWKFRSSGYYAWRKRLSEPPKLKRKTLAQLVKSCYWQNRRRYGVRRIKAALNKEGIKIGQIQGSPIDARRRLKGNSAKEF